jgi:catechol 2,3-dioxygenase-like lactoylglutathione lyase family enzyme
VVAIGAVAVVAAEIAEVAAAVVETAAVARGTSNPFMSIKSLAHVCLKSTDLDATAAFYCGALGMKRLFDFTRKGKVIGFYMKADNTTFVEVFEAGETAPIEHQVLNHLCLETSDIVALQKALAARGLQPGEVKMGADNSYQFWMKDPNGMSMEFHQYTDKSAQFTGETVEVDW